MSKHSNKKSKRSISPVYLGGTILLLVFLAFIWVQYITPRVIPRKWGVVRPGMIYRSGQLNQYLAERMLRTRDIEVIVDLTFEDLPNEPGQRAELAAAEKLGIQHHRFPLRGWGTGKIEHYVGAVEQIDRAVRQGKPVLVHCTAGAQRTGGVLAVYRLLIEGAHPQEVMREMQQYGWDPVDDEFMLGFLNDNMREFARRLKEKGVIEQIPVPLPRLIP